MTVSPTAILSAGRSLDMRACGVVPGRQLDLAVGETAILLHPTNCSSFFNSDVKGVSAK